MAALCVGWLAFTAPLPAQEKSDFGSAEFNDAALIGILYDFKQTQQREKVPMNAKRYYALIEDFINSGYDESMLNKYFRATRALYTTQIFIPHRSAKEGPKAFGVEKIVKPSYWLMHYKGQVLPPEPGEYEFVATADGFIALAVNGKTLLVKHNTNNDKYIKQFGGKMGPRGVNSDLRYSMPFTSDGKTPLDLDVLLAEAGGEFNAFLYVVRKGDEAEGPLTVFQLAPGEIPSGKTPPYATAKAYWQAVP